MEEDKQNEGIPQKRKTPRNKNDVVELSEHESFIALLTGDRKAKLTSALNPLTKEEVLDILAGDSDEAVRASVALNPSASVATLERLAEDPVFHVVACVATNDSAPEGLLERLSRSAEDEVRVAAASNPSCPSESMWRLSMDRSADARINIALNPYTADEIVEVLKDDPDPCVRQAASMDCPTRTKFDPYGLVQRMSRALSPRMWLEDN